MDQQFGEGRSGSGSPGPDSRYAWYVVVVLMGVYTLCWMDRTILSILAEDLKHHFSLTDAQLGFLHGTAFGVFYSLFGYPLARLADRWNRVHLLSICLALWSAMTVFCGLAANVGQLVTARIGVAIGEAAAYPSGYSLMADWFSRKRRGTAFGIFSCGFYLGQGLAFVAGGMVVFHWMATFGEIGPFGLRGWQATFLLVGLPGVILALVVRSLREPARGLSDGTRPPEEHNVLRRFFEDIATVIPPFTLYQAALNGRVSIAVNVGVALLIAVLSWTLVLITGDLLQWVVFGIGCYAAFSAAQMLHYRDRAIFALTWRTPAFIYTMVGFGFTSMLALNMGFWTAPLALRALPIDKATAGTILGVTAAVCGMTGVLFGGRLSDMMITRYPAGRVYVGMLSAIIPVPFVIGMCLTHNPWVFFLLNVPVVFTGIMWMAAGAATVQELVLPRMRATASVIYVLVSTLVGSALGPYLIGKISAIRGDLAEAVMTGTFVVPIALMALWMASRCVQSADATKIARAEAAGEVIRMA